MKCSKCGADYEDSFKFCPNCAEVNPSAKKEEPAVVKPPVSPIEESSVILTPTEKPPALPLEPPKPKKKLSESIKPVVAKGKEKSAKMTAKIREKTNKKTILIGVGILVLIIAALVVAVVLTRPSYPATIKLGDFKQGDLSVKRLTLIKGEKTGDNLSYELTGTALGKWNGQATINLRTTTNKGPQTEKFELTIKRNDEEAIKTLTSLNRDNTVFVSNPIQKCEVQSITYDGKMNADDFMSIDNVTNGLTLNTGANVITGTVKEDGCAVTFNGQPVQIGPDKKFSVTANINEGSNRLSFEVAEKSGAKTTKTLTLTGQIPPAQYKASCPAGPPFANLNKDPNSFKGTLVHYRGQVAQAMVSGGETDLRVSITNDGYGFWTDTIYVVLQGTTPAVENSIVDIYGTVAGSYTYTSEANYKITLPEVDARYVDVSQ